MIFGVFDMAIASAIAVGIGEDAAAGDAEGSDIDSGRLKGVGEPYGGCVCGSMPSGVV